MIKSALAETPVSIKLPTRKEIEDALIQAGIAQSHPNYMGGRVAFVFSPRFTIDTLFVNLHQYDDPELGHFGITLDEVFEYYASLDQNRETVLKALEIARSLGWSEHNGGISDTWD